MKLFAAVVVLAVLVVAYLAADTVVRDRVQADIASRIEGTVPGTSAKVTISSEPFTGHLAVGGDVPALAATVTGLSVDGFGVESVVLHVRDLKVSRSDLVHGRVVLRSISSATVDATVTQSAVDAAVGLPVTLGNGSVGLAGVQAPATVAVAGDRLRIAVAGLPALSLPLLPRSLLPCDVSGTIVPGGLDLSCTTSTLPPALVGAVAGS